MITLYSEDCVFETILHLLCSLVPVVSQDGAQNFVGQEVRDVLYDGQWIDVGDVEVPQVVLRFLQNR